MENNLGIERQRNLGEIVGKLDAITELIQSWRGTASVALCSVRAYQTIRVCTGMGRKFRFRVEGCQLSPAGA